MTNHDSDSVHKRQKREIARDTRAVQACEACSQSHLRCEDEKPCSRCKKRNIPCRVPEQATADDNDVNEDTVHAAQDLLGLSSRLDFSATHSPAEDSVKQGSTSTYSTHDSHSHFDHSSSASTGYAINNAPMELSIAQQHHSLDAPTHLPPPVNYGPASHAIHQPYTDNHSTSMHYYNNTIPHYDPVSSHDAMPTDYYPHMPSFPAINPSHEAPRGLMDLSFNLDLSLTDVDMGLLDQYNFQIPFDADTPSNDARELEPQPPDSASVSVRAEAFMQSVWRYNPQSDTCYLKAEQVGLATFSDTEQDRGRRSHIARNRAIVERLPSTSRDKLMALVLGTSSPENAPKIASAFPSLDLLDGLIQFFLTSPSFDAQSWIHLPTFSPAKINPELLAAIVAAGAVATPDSKYYWNHIICDTNADPI